MLGTSLATEPSFPLIFNHNLRCNILSHNYRMTGNFKSNLNTLKKPSRYYLKNAING